VSGGWGGSGGGDGRDWKCNWLECNHQTTDSVDEECDNGTAYKHRVAQQRPAEILKVDATDGTDVHSEHVVDMWRTCGGHVADIIVEDMWRTCGGQKLTCMRRNGDSSTAPPSVPVLPCPSGSALLPPPKNFFMMPTPRLRPNDATLSGRSPKELLRFRVDPASTWSCMRTCVRVCACTHAYGCVRACVRIRSSGWA